MSFDSHDNCRRCGDLDGPGHTATECERARARRREAQAAHDSQKTAPDSSLPLVTRRADGKHFRIVCQARSPDGPVDLVACDGPPFERVSVSGREFVHLYDDPRKAPPARPFAAASPHVDVTVPATGGFVNLRSASGGMEAVWLRVVDDHGRRVTYDRATGEHVAAPVRLTPSEAGHLADALRRYADTHRESDQ